MSHLESNQSLLSDGKTTVTETFPGQMRRAKSIWNNLLIKPYTQSSQGSAMKFSKYDKNEAGQR